MFPHEPALVDLSGKLLVFMAKNVDVIISSPSGLINLSPEDMKDLLACPHLQLDRQAAQAFLASWTSTRRVTRLTTGALSRLADLPTSSRLPARVILAAGGWSNVSVSLLPSDCF